LCISMPSTDYKAHLYHAELEACMPSRLSAGAQNAVSKEDL